MADDTLLLAGAWKDTKTDEDIGANWGVLCGLARGCSRSAQCLSWLFFVFPMRPGQMVSRGRLPPPPLFVGQIVSLV